MPKKQLRPTVARFSERGVSRQQLPPLTLVRSSPPAPVALDEEPEVFDIDDDIASIIPMSPAIPDGTRAEITRRIGEKFEYSDQLDAWLHAPHAQLEGDTPFDRVVQGDGMAVLRVLRAEEGALDVQGPAGSGHQPPTLRLVR